MYKKIPGNNDYLINSKYQVIDTFGIHIQLPRNRDNTVNIWMFGKIRKYNENWLANLARYETGVIMNLEKYLNFIGFYPVVALSLAKVNPFAMSFSEPIYYKDGFRIIPNYPRYAINIDSVVIDTITDKIVEKRELDHGYEVIYVYNSNKSAFRYTRIHRLLCHAWLPNKDFINKPIINHIDGNKTNNHLSNLEWCSYLENNIHARDIGLTGQAVKMKTRDVFTGDVVIYNSAAELSHFLGTTSISSKNHLSRLPGYLYKRRYEIKALDDETPWFYETNEIKKEDIGKSYVTITVLDKATGETKKFNSSKSFYRFYNLWLDSFEINKAISKLKERNGNLDISYIRNVTTGPYRVLDIVSKQITVFTSIKKASEFINIGINELTFDLSREMKFIYLNKWIVANGTDDIDILNYKVKAKPFRKVEIVKENDLSNIQVADSIRAASRLTKIQKKTIMLHLNKGTSTSGYIFRTLES